jgi:lauroyl/myristoyl acyltransferase
MKEGAQENKSTGNSKDAVPQFVAAAFFKLYVTILRLLSPLPMPKAFLVSRLVNPLFTFPIRHQRRENIARLFPEPGWTQQKRRQLEKDHLEYLALVRARMAHIFLSLTSEGVRQSASLIGGEHLKAALAKGKGVLVIEGHFGDWNCTPSLLSALGYQVTAVINPNPLRGANFRMLHEGVGRRLGIKLAFVGQDAYSAAKEVFTRNDIFYLNFDVAVRTKHAQWYPFGDASILLDTGPAIMALRHRVPVLYAESRLASTGTQITLIPALDASSPSERPTAETLLRSWLSEFQKTVTGCPEQWWALNYISLGDQAPDHNPELRNGEQNCHAAPTLK